MYAGAALSLVRLRILLPIAVALAVGCSAAPYRPPVDARPPARSTVPQQPSAPSTMTDPGVDIARLASQLVGSRYRYGGSGPDEFDCSGLVFFVHDRLGIRVPRTAAQQSAAASPVAPSALRPGDLVFFREASRTITHVGVYTGNDTFVHAPKNGRAVGYGSLADAYYREYFAGAGRLYARP